MATTIEAKVMNRLYANPQAARSGVNRSRLHGKVKKRLLKEIDEWEAATVSQGPFTAEDQPDDDLCPPIQTVDVMEEDRRRRNIMGAGSTAAGMVVKLPSASLYGKLGATHVSQSLLDRAAMTLLAYAVKNNCSMSVAFDALKTRIDGIGIDG